MSYNLNELGIRERLKYKDISWLMSSIDVENVLNRLGTTVSSKSGHVLRALCPDHHLFVGRNSSDPNWFINSETGETFCHTEGRGSNLVYIVCRLLDCQPDEAVKFMLGSDIDMAGLEIAACRVKMDKMKYKDEEEKPEVKGLNVVLHDIHNRYLSENAYNFFIHPPGKKYPTNINRETVDRYKVFERTWGLYANCVIIPFFLNKELVGFCAIDILGKSDWLRLNPLKSEKNYKKVRYPLNFCSSKFLFGYDDCQKSSDFLVVVEGPREVMKLWQEGFTNSVALLGSYLSDEQKKLISTLCPKNIVLMFDGDDAGVEATTSVAKKLYDLFPNQRTKKCFLPRGRDPKTLNRQELEKIIFSKTNS